MGEPQAKEAEDQNTLQIEPLGAINSTEMSASPIGEKFYGSESLYEFSEWYAKYHGYVSLVVCIYGIVTNVFNIMVLTRKNMISTTNLILLGLAVSDLLTMVSYVPSALQFYCVYGVKPSPARNSHNWVVFFLFHVNFTVTTHTISIWLGVLLSVFRYLYVKCSTDGAVRCSIARAKIAIVLVYLSSVITLIPNYMSLTILDWPDPEGTNQTLYDITSIDASTPYGHTLTTLNFWIHAILIKIIPCALMSVFGFLLVFTMKHTQRRTKRLRRNSRPEFYRSRSREHSRTTRMLVVVIVLFLITELPQGILALLSGLMPGFFTAYYVPLGDLMDIIALINNAINFTLYCTMSKQFRDTFLRLFCPTSTSPSSRPKRLTNGTSLHDNNVSQSTTQKTGLTAV